ncbi:hypothetical protein Hanom_Chr08g00697451 [Helianthus anomalus]
MAMIGETNMVARKKNDRLGFRQKQILDKARVPANIRFESEVSLEAFSLFIRGTGKVVYILPSSDPTFALLWVRFTEYDDDNDE